MADFTFASKYAHHQKSLKRREDWEESSDRSLLMHLKKFPFLSDEAKAELIWAFDMVKAKMVTPSMRSMQFGGIAVESKNQKLYNCAVRHINSLRSFAESFHLLLNGCGVGFGLNKRFLSQIPNLVSAKDKTGAVLCYTIDDTIEGWADSVEVLLMCYSKNTPLSGKKIVFDYSKIRKKGTPLKTSGGKAPGHEGLKNAHIKIKGLLDHIIEDLGLTRMRSIDVYDILMHCADATLSGGVRRSACSVIFELDDDDMMNAKTFFSVQSHKRFVLDKDTGRYHGIVVVNNKKYVVDVLEFDYNQIINDGKISWFYIEPQRARSNNSVMLLRSKCTIDLFKSIIEKTRQFGEPNFVFANDEYCLLNPCFEIIMYPIVDGVPGVQFCNLTTQNGKKITSLEIFKETSRAAAIIGTCQAAYTSFDYLSNASVQITEGEALLGVSITGMMDNPEILLNPENQRTCALIVNETNRRWAKMLGINPAARTTCIKPEGTSSIVLESGSGIHPHHAKRYIRRIQCNKLDVVYKYFKKHNPHACEASVWSANQTDDVISFPVTLPDTVKTKKDLGAIEHLNIIKSTQQNWVIPGSRKPENKLDMDHNVSCTVIVKDHEWDEVIQYVFDNREFFTAVSFLPDTGDKIYQQAPNEAIVTEEDEIKFKALLDNWNKVDYTKLKEEDDATNLTAEAVCAGGMCEVVRIN